MFPPLPCSADGRETGALSSPNSPGSAPGKDTSCSGITDTSKLSVLVEWVCTAQTNRLDRDWGPVSKMVELMQESGGSEGDVEVAVQCSAH